jgi:hypothetical protein
MRVLVAGRNAKVLAKAAGTFANDLEIHTAATKAACLALLGRIEFDLIVACETLADGSGLEVLSHVAVNTPNTLRIFAARPATLILLKSELGLFGLFRTLPYPINFRKLWAAISLAREACAEEVVAAPGPPVRHVVLEETWSAADLGAVTAAKLPRPPVAESRAAKSRATTAAPRAQAPSGQRPPQRQTVAVPATARPAQRNAATTTRTQRLQQRAAAPADVPPLHQDVTTPARGRPSPPATRASPLPPAVRPQAPVRSNVQPDKQGAAMPPPARQQVQHRAATRATPARGKAQGGGQPTPEPTRVIAAAPRRQPQAARRQEITSGMRAAARYAAAHSGRGPGGAEPARIPESDAFKRARARREAGRLEPIVSNESLTQLAKLALTSRPPPVFRGAPAAKKRAAFFVGSGVFAATTAAVLTFFMVSANNSVKHPKLPVIASITQPVPTKVFPWQPETQQPPSQAAFMRSEAPASAVADLEAEAEAASESPDGDPDHPGPPPPNAPPPPSEPPSLESPAQWVDE